MSNYTWAKGTEKEEVVGKKGMVVSADKLASQAGVEILERGGNAVDAAVATSFAVGVVEPMMSGIGGGGAINIRLASGESCAIDAFVMAPKDLDRFDWSTVGPKAVAVPGLLDGLCFALEKYGTMELSEVLAPAVRYAEGGYTVSEYLANEIAHTRGRLDGASARILYVKGLERPLMEGERLVNRDYGETLRRIGEDGKEIFFEGDIANAIVGYMEENGGLITNGDLASYQARVNDPLTTDYKEYTIHGVPYAHGGTTVAHIMKIIEEYDLTGLGHNTVESIHLVAESEKRAFVDRMAFYGDSSYVKVPWEGLLSEGYAEELRKGIDLKRSSGAVEPGKPWRYHPSGESLGRIKPAVGTERGDTTSLSVVDEDRNMVCLTQSLGDIFGNWLCVPGTGIFLNNFMISPGRGAGFFPLRGHPNSVEGWKRPLNNHSPTIVLKGDEPHMTVGSPAGRRQQGACCQVMLNVFEHSMGIQEAISAPRIHCEGNVLWIESRVPAEVRERLAGMGHEVVSTPDYFMFFGGAQGILLDIKGTLHGGADPRRMCTAMGYS